MMEADFVFCVCVCSAKQLVRGEPNVSYICSRYYRAPELIFGATDYTSSIGTLQLTSALSTDYVSSIGPLTLTSALFTDYTSSIGQLTLTLDLFTDYISRIGPLTLTSALFPNLPHRCTRTNISPIHKYYTSTYQHHTTSAPFIYAIPRALVS